AVRGPGIPAGPPAGPGLGAPGAGNVRVLPVPSRRAGGAARTGRDLLLLKFRRLLRRPARLVPAVVMATAAAATVLAHGGPSRAETASAFQLPIASGGTGTVTQADNMPSKSPTVRDHLAGPRR